MDKYEPELGQAIFGQPHKEYKVSNWVEGALEMIAEKMDEDEERFPWGSPFSNSGARFKNDVFEAYAYDWNDENEQLYNFKWRDFEVSWYKYLGRGMSCNREMTPKEVIEMLAECLLSLGVSVK